MGLAILGTLVFLVDREELLRALRDAKYGYLVLAVALYFAGQWFRGLRWQYLLRGIARVPVRRLYGVLMVGYLANNVLPLRLGELVRVVWLCRREPEVSVGGAVATLGVERVYDGMTLLTVGACCVPLLALSGLLDGLTEGRRAVALVVMVVLSGGCVAALGLLVAVSVNARCANLLMRSTAMVPRKFRGGALDVVDGFVVGLRTLRSPKKQGVLLISSVPVWLGEALVYLLVAYSFGLEGWFDSFWLLVAVVVVVTVASNLVTVVPSSIGGIGPFEAVAQHVLVMVGVDASVAVAYAITVHLVALWLPVNLVGLVFLVLERSSADRGSAAVVREEIVGVAEPLERNL